jgi:uncharacterized protein (UPF0371 family)
MTNLPFNGPLYIEKQTQAILDRLAETDGPLYLEVGGHFLIDNHASRVLPGYIPDSKAQIFKKLTETVDLSIIFCINAKDVVRDRQFSQKYVAFEKYLLKELESIKNILNITPSICFTMLDHDFIPPHIRELESLLQSQWYHTYHKYMIDGYPNNTSHILSDHGYGKDDHIIYTQRDKQSLILVSACGSNSGKFNTCLSQLYLDHNQKIASSYAKFETFPIRNRSVDHPANLAYEAATADIGDYNMIDPYYKDWVSVNYNRDVEAFEILKSFSQNPQFVIRNSQSYNSPTEMWINTAGFCITDNTETQKQLSDAAHAEIQSRLDLFTKLLNSGHGEEDAVERCQELLKKF